MSNSTISAERAEPPGSESEPRKFAPVIAGILRDARNVVSDIRQHQLALPPNTSIEDVHGETTLRLSVLLAEAGDAKQVTFSLNGAPLANERMFTKDNADQGITIDMQEALDRKDPNALRLVMLCEKTLGRVQTRVLNLRPPETAFQG